MLPKAIISVAVLAVAVAACGGGSSGTAADSATADPERGATVFAATCSECHGSLAAGTDRLAQRLSCYLVQGQTNFNHSKNTCPGSTHEL